MEAAFETQCPPRQQTTHSFLSSSPPQATDEFAGVIKPTVYFGNNVSKITSVGRACPGI